MSTRSYILIKSKNTYKGIYCHWDGYPSHNGMILKRHYKHKRKIKQLISLGDISSLRQKVVPYKQHTFDSKLQDVTIAYHRDRKDKFNSVSFHITELSDAINDVSYVYIFEKGRWKCFDSNGEVIILPE